MNTRVENNEVDLKTSVAFLERKCWGVLSLCHKMDESRLDIAKYNVG